MSRSTADSALRLEPEAWVLQTPSGSFTQLLEGASPVAALRRLDADAVRRKGMLNVVIADGWLRYLVVSWPEGVNRAEERKAFVAHRFSEVHGVGAPDWLLEVDLGAGTSPALACAAPAALAAEVQEFASTRGLRLGSVEGVFVDAYNRLRRAFREPRGSVGALAVARNGRATVGMWCDGSWHALRSQALGYGDTEGVRLMLEAWIRGDSALGGERSGTGVLYVDGLVASGPTGWRVAAAGEGA